MAREKLCVYNLTRQSFLSLEVGVADTHLSRLRGLLGRRRLRSGEGLWVVPCQGVHTIGVLFPIDVVYLDEHLRVIHLVESLAPFRISPVRRAGRSVLELPPRTIFMSHTEVGDQFLICTPQEFEDFWHAQPAPGPNGSLPPADPVVSRANGAPLEPFRSPPAWYRDWARRLRRKGRAARYTDLPLSAGHWVGGVPQPITLLNISETGAYLGTKEMWQPGAAFELTLQANRWVKDDERWLCNPHVRVLARVVRCDVHGVGVRFVWSSPEQAEQLRRLLAMARNCGPFGALASGRRGVKTS